MTGRSGGTRPPTGQIARLEPAPPGRPEPAASRPTGAHPAPAPPVPVAGRFRTATAALSCVGALIAAGRAQDAQFRTGSGSWWVLAALDLDLGRSIVDSANGAAYVRVDGWLVRDRGFGAAPQRRGAEDIDPGTLTPVSLLDLVRQSGLHTTRPNPLSAAAVLLPGLAMTAVVRRALDLRLDVSYRAVRLEPLFAGSSAGDQTTLIELSLRAAARTIPTAFLGAAARYPQAAVFRPAGDGRLLVQHGKASPLADEQLAMLVDGGTWVLADAAFGCWRLDAMGDWLDSSGLVRLDDDLPLADQRPLGSHHVVTESAVRLVPARLPGQRVDAVLLDDADLANLALLLEHHPLAEIAVVVLGKDRHLVLAAGGVLEQLPVGEPLACVGPGPLYVPLGRRLSPRLPPSARQAMYEPDAQHAVVLTDRGGLRFSLDARRPVWKLWVGDPPPADLRLPAGSAAALRALDEADGAAPPVAVRRSAQTAARSWRDEALAAELAGNLAGAAELHRRHNEPLRAAHLFERAAREALDRRPGG